MHNFQVLIKFIQVCFFRLSVESLGSVISTQSSISGGVQPEYLHTSSITYQHNRRTFWIYLYSDYGGLISFKLSIVKCQYECGGCIENYPRFCLQRKLHQYSRNSNYITTNWWSYYSILKEVTTNVVFCDLLIFSQIEYQTQLPPQQLYLIEILIKDQHDPIQQLNFKSSSLSYMRDFEAFYTEPEIMFKKLNEGCFEQIDTRFMICQESWIYNWFLENCHPICGDKGQFQKQQQINSMTVPQSKLILDTLICKEVFDLKVVFENCRPICGDGVIQGQEKCHDANLISNDFVINVNFHVQTFAKLVNLEFVLNVFMEMIIMLILIVSLCVELAIQFPIRLNNAI
ncbi:unnamed protein product [Paramecium octaurelia]|uniref:ShKT domain-containing protein n=1 Tax=Paramecium octaurelia TaxID=43137 RepID=A0A8S1YMM4_PAROT|nr:unnamed protein product [Paramecium octaurelia]